MDQSTIEEYVNQLIAAADAGHPKPLLRSLMPDATELTAYDALGQYVAYRQKNHAISGFKAALTNTGAQKMFGTNSSAMGVLFSNKVITPDSTIDITNYLMPLIETEIGFLVTRDLPAQTSPISSQQLLAYIGHALPMIEIVDVGVAGKLAGATDLIAINNAAANYIPGKHSGEISVESLEKLDDVTVNLSKNGETLGSGHGNDSMNSQTKALAWLVNSILSQGYAINAGAYLMTGSLGKPYPASPGKYCADYGNFGSINFEFI